MPLYLPHAFHAKSVCETALSSFFRVSSKIATTVSRHAEVQIPAVLTEIEPMYPTV
jgi:hypothetical protein